MLKEEFAHSGNNKDLLQPKRSVTINGHKISVTGYSKRSSVSTISALAIKEEQNFVAVDEILDNFGICNPYILFIILSMGICWSLSIMNVMSSMFYESGLKCNPKDKECLKERWRIFTIEDQFHIHENSFFTIEMTTSVFFFGDLFGGVLLSFLSDIIGRRVVVFPSIILLNLFGILSTYAQTYENFLLIKFFEGFFFTSSCIIVWIYVSENVSIKNHAKALTIFGFFWVFGYCMVPFIAKFVNDWREAKILLCAPSVILAIFLYFAMPESFHFLAEHSRAKSLKKWLRRADKNLYELAFLTRVLEDKPVRHSFHQFFHFMQENRTYILYLILLSINWIISFCIYFGLSLYGIHFGENAYIFSGLIELPAFLLAPFLLDRYLLTFFNINNLFDFGFGRKKSLVLVCLFSLCAFSLLSILNQSNRLVFISVFLLAKFGAASLFSYLFVYGSEIFPTVIRNTSLGICAIFSNLGAVFAPHVHYTSELHSSLPWMIFGLLATISTLCIMGLPETKPNSKSKYLVVYNGM